MINILEVDAKRLVEGLCVLKPFINTRGIMVHDSILFRVEGGELELVGTDRIKMGRFLFGKVSCKKDVDIIVPAGEVDNLISVLMGKDFIEISVDKGMADIKCGGEVLKTFAHSFWREKYPSYKELFTGCDKVLRVDCDRLKRALKSATGLYRGSDKIDLKMDVVYSDRGELELSVVLSDGGASGVFKIKTEGCDLPSMKFVVNPFIFMSMVDMVSSSTFIIPTFDIGISSGGLKGGAYSGPLFVRLSDRLESLVLTLDVLD